eukprot:3313477-Ditylum_brightwellii.AAC.1
MSYCILPANVLGTCVIIGAPDVSGDDVIDSWSVPFDVIPFWHLARVMSAHLQPQVFWVSPYSVLSQSWPMDINVPDLLS